MRAIYSYFSSEFRIWRSVYIFFRRRPRRGGSLSSSSVSRFCSMDFRSRSPRDWDGYYPLTYKGFWLEWVGNIVPFIWLSVESIRQYALARRRVRLGFSDPITCNRFLLIGTYATLASFTYFIYVRMYIIYELYDEWPLAMDVALGFVEAVSLIALSISFSAPAFYRRWVGGDPTEASQER